MVASGTAERGVKFIVSTELDSNVAKPFEVMEQHVAALEKRLKGLTIPAPKIAGATRLASVASPAAVSSPAGTDAGISKLEAAEKASLRRRLDARREFDEKLRVGAEKTAADNEKFNRQMLDQQIKDLKKAEADKDKILADAAARRVAEAKREQKADQAFWSDFERFGENRAKLKADAERKEAREKQQAHQAALRAAAEQREAQSKLENGIYNSIHAIGQLGRAFAQFGLIGQENMRRVLDTVFAVEGSINAVQGGVDAFRSIRGLREALAARSAAGAATTIASGATGLAGAGGTAAGGVGLGLTGAGVGAAALGTLGLMGSIIDRRRGVAGNVGGVWDTIGGAINAPVGFVNRGLMGLGSKIERSFNASYGLTQFQTEERSLRLNEAEFKRDFGAEEGKDESYYAAKKRADLWEERTQLMERRTRAKIDERQAMLDRHELIDSTVGRLEAEQRGAGYRLAEQRYGIRAGNLQRRGAVHRQLLNEAFGRQREAYGEQLALRQARALGQFVSPEQAARAAAEAAREEGLTTSHDAARLNNLRLQHTANLQRGREIGQEFHAARMRLAEAQGDAGSPAGRENAAQEMAAADERLKRNAEERAKLEQEIRHVGIDGAQRQLQLREQSLATAKQTADTLRQQNQSAKERFGQLLPSQQRSILDAARDASQGGELSRHRANQLRQFPELFGERLRQHDVQRAELGGYGELEKFSGMRGRINKAEGVEQREMKLTVEQRASIAADLHFDAGQAASDIARIFLPLLQRAHDDLIQQVDKKISDANREMTRRQNMQGRQGAGG